MKIGNVYRMDLSEMRKLYGVGMPKFRSHVLLIEFTHKVWFVPLTSQEIEEPTVPITVYYESNRSEELHAAIQSIVPMERSKARGRTTVRRNQDDGFISEEDIEMLKSKFREIFT